MRTKSYKTLYYTYYKQQIPVKIHKTINSGTYLIQRTSCGHQQSVGLHEKEPQQFILDIRQSTRLPSEDLDPQRRHCGELSEDVTHGDHGVVRYLLKTERLPVLYYHGSSGGCGAFSRIAETQQRGLHQAMEWSAHGDDHVTVGFDEWAASPGPVLQGAVFVYAAN